MSYQHHFDGKGDPPKYAPADNTAVRNIKGSKDYRLVEQYDQPYNVITGKTIKKGSVDDSELDINPSDNESAANTIKKFMNKEKGGVILP